MPRPRNAATTLRANLAAVMQEDVTIDHVRRIVLEALTGETKSSVTCPECGLEFKAPLPRIREQVQNVKDLLEQVEGKPAEQKPEALTVTIVRPAVA